MELDDQRFIRDPHLPAGVVDQARIDAMFAMSPTERLRWNECWKQFIRECLRRGASAEEIEAAVYGTNAGDEPG